MEMIKLRVGGLPGNVIMVWGAAEGGAPQSLGEMPGVHA